MKSEAVTTVGKLMRTLGFHDTSRASSNKFIKDYALRVLFLQPYGKGVSQFISMTQAEEVRERVEAKELAKLTSEQALKMVVVPDLQTQIPEIQESTEGKIKLDALRSDVNALKRYIKDELQQLQEAAKFFNSAMSSMANDVQFLRKELTGEA